MVNVLQDTDYGS